MLSVGVAGAGGKMGSLIVRLVVESGDLQLAGALEVPGHPGVGRDAGELAGKGTTGVRITDGVGQAFDGCTCIVDFTFPDATLELVRYASHRGKAMVIGTTGLSEEQREEISLHARNIPIVVSPNMSVGVNVMFRLVEEVARILGDGYDAEVLEAHHRMKKDAPSGTALALAQAVARGRGVDLAGCARYSRHGNIGERPIGEIGIQTVRAGDIVGDHTVIFAGPGERIEIVHRAHTRENFARGALKAARWVVGRPAGLYSMADVLEFPHGDR